MTPEGVRAQFSWRSIPPLLAGGCLLFGLLVGLGQLQRQQAGLAELTLRILALERAMWGVPLPLPGVLRGEWSDIPYAIAGGVNRGPR